MMNRYHLLSQHDVSNLMINNTQIAGHDLVLEVRAHRNVDSLAVVGDDDDGALQSGRFDG